MTYPQGKGYHNLFSRTTIVLRQSKISYVDHSYLPGMEIFDHTRFVFAVSVALQKCVQNLPLISVCVYGHTKTMFRG